MRLVDTHVHINFEAFQSDLDEVAQRWRESGVAHLVHSCVEPSEFAGIRALADRYPEVSFAVGLHPLDANQWNNALGEEIQALAQSDRRVVAIGETGLDFYKSDQIALQHEALAAQLRIAAALDLPVILHCRDAAESLAQVLSQFNTQLKAQGKALKGVMHCWGGSPEETAWFLELGFYISFSGTVTFKKAEAIQASARIVPSDRLLVETDCPFLAPVPQRGKRNEPSFVRHVAEQVAHLRGISPEALANQTSQNACDLFGLSIP